MTINVEHTTKKGLSLTTVDPRKDATDFVRTLNLPTEISVISIKKLTFAEKAVIALLYSFVSNKNSFFGSNQFIADSIGLESARSARRILLSLEQKGYIMRKLSKDKDGNIIREQIVLGQKALDIVNIKGEDTDVLGVGLGRPTPWVSDVHILNNITKQTTNISSDTDKLKLEFWKLYPRKVNKTKTFKLLTLLEPELPTILEKLKTYKFSTDIKYIPHPTTWLNNRRWEDEDGTMTSDNSAATEISFN